MYVSMSSLNSRHLTVLRSVSAEARSIGEIARDIGLSHGRTSQLVEELRQSGFLGKDRRGNTVYAHFSDRLSAEYLRRIILMDSVDTSALLSRPCFDIFITISDREISAERIADETGVRRSQVSKSLLSLEEKGILSRHDDKVRLSRSLPHLTLFARTYSSYCNHRTLREVSAKGVIVWENPREFIFTVPVDEEITDAVATGISAVSRHGIDIVSDRAYYHRFDSGRELRHEDIAIDTILASNSGPRGILCALLFLRKIGDLDRKYLISRGEEVGLEDTMRDLLRFLDGKETKPKDFPSREEFSAICAQYGV